MFNGMIKIVDNSSKLGVYDNIGGYESNVGSAAKKHLSTRANHRQINLTVKPKKPKNGRSTSQSLNVTAESENRNRYRKPGENIPYQYRTKALAKSGSVQSANNFRLQSSSQKVLSAMVNKQAPVIKYYQPDILGISQINTTQAPRTLTASQQKARRR